jgi:hypothetical protein
MSNWLDKTLVKLLPSHTQHIIASDPDGILGYHEIIKAIENRGVTIIRASSALEARVRFELEVRESDKKSVLIINAPYQPLPDMLMDAYLVTLGYKDIFPYFAPKALDGLSYNALSTLDELRPYDTLSYDATLKFLLENLYHIDLDALNKFKTKERMLATLIDVVFHKDNVSAPVTAFLKSIAKPLFSADTEQLLSQDGLKGYLQGQWDMQADGTESSINFSDPLLAKSLGNLFVMRVLHPVQINQEAMDNIPLSLRMGFYVDESAEICTRVTALIDFIRSRTVSIQDQFSEWHELGKTIGEAYCLALTLNDPDKMQQVKDALSALNNRFQRFMHNSYWTLFSLSGSRCPAVISRVLDYIHAQQSAKKALIVIDGMNVWQWHAINQELTEQGISVNQMATLAYLPSITAWSRQALLKGTKPDLEKDNSGEEKLFREYWTGKGYQNYQVVYQRFGVEKPLNVDSLSSASIMALVCNDLDNLMHGAVMGDEQLLQDTQQWVRKAGLPQIIKTLRNQGYICFITTDHGNIEASAASTLPMSAKNLSTSKSKRHIRFVSNKQAEQFQKDNPGLAIKRRESSLYLTDDTAFIKDGKVITHGGSHVLELIIPLGVIE